MSPPPPIFDLDAPDARILEKVRAEWGAQGRRGQPAATRLAANAIGHPRRALARSRARNLVDSGTGLAAKVRGVGLSRCSVWRHLSKLPAGQSPGVISDSRVAGSRGCGDASPNRSKR